MTAPIETRDLSKSYGAIVALDGLTLQVPASTCVGFLGPNGAGKTTTIKILTNLLRPTKGAAYIDGRDVQEDPKGALQSVGAVVETPEFYRELTPREVLAYLGRIRGMSAGDLETAIPAAIAEVGMTEWADVRMGKFSKGMGQRIAIAQALLHKPDLLILDEPTSGLDPRGMAEVRDLIQRLKRDGYTIFMSSHLLFEVEAVCDRVAIVDRGHLVAYDAVENLSNLRGMAKLEVETLNPISPDVFDAIAALPGVKGVQCPTSQKAYVDFEGDAAGRAALLASLASLGLQVYSFRDTGLALENAYMNLVGASSR